MKISVQSLFEDYEDDTVELRRDADTARILDGIVFIVLKQTIPSSCAATPTQPAFSKKPWQSCPGRAESARSTSC